MSKKILSIALIMSFLVSAANAASKVESIDAMKARRPRTFNYPIGHEYVVDMFLVEKGGDIYLYESYEGACSCGYGSDCSESKEPSAVYTFNDPTAELSFEQKLNGEEYLWYEEGVELSENDYKVTASTNDNDLCYNSTMDSKYKEEEEKKDWSNYYDRTFEYTSEIKKKFMLNGNEVSEGENILLAQKGRPVLTLEAIDCVKECWTCNEENNNPKSKNRYTFTEGTTTYETASITIEKTLNVGPYPTIHFDVHLIDDNTSLHKDKVAIKNGKMTCTHKPEGVIFELYNNSGVLVDTYERSFSDGDVIIAERGDGLGWNVTWSDVEWNLGQNVNLAPETGYYIKALVDDWRVDNTAYGYSQARSSASFLEPSTPKYAVFQNFTME